jgi:hypothetical protein
MRRHKALFLLLLMWAFSPCLFVAASPIGFNAVAIDPSVKVSYYPNPCPKVLNIDVAFEKNASQIEIHFRSMIGKDVIDFVSDDKTTFNNHYELDLSEIPAGVYLLEVVTYANGVANKSIKRITKI